MGVSYLEHEGGPAGRRGDVEKISFRVVAGEKRSEKKAG